VNEKSRGVKDNKATYPRENQNQRQNEEHVTLFLFADVSDVCLSCWDGTAEEKVCAGGKNVRADSMGSRPHDWEGP
jgi:hypothetical protein